MLLSHIVQNFTTFHCLWSLHRGTGFQPVLAIFKLRARLEARLRLP